MTLEAYTDADYAGSVDDRRMFVRHLLTLDGDNP